MQSEVSQKQKYKHSIKSESESEVTQSFPTPCDPMDCSLPGSSLHGILQARIQEWVAMSFSSIYCIERKESEVAQSCPTFCDPMDCILSGSSVHGIFQAIVLEWIAISFSRGSSRPRDQTRISHIVDRCFTLWATREVTLGLLYLFFQGASVF